MSCWRTFSGPSPSAPLTSGSAHRLWRGHYSGPGAWYRGTGRGTSATGEGEERARGSQGLGEQNHSPFADFPGQQEPHTDGGDWPIVFSHQLRGGVASAHLGLEGAWPHFTSVPQTPCDEARAEPRVTWSPQAPRDQASSPVPSPYVTQPRRGGASPVLSTQT